MWHALFPTILRIVFKSAYLIQFIAYKRVFYAITFIVHECKLQSLLFFFSCVSLEIGIAHKRTHSDPASVCVCVWVCLWDWVRARVSVHCTELCSETVNAYKYIYIVYVHVQFKISGLKCRWHFLVENDNSKVFLRLM